MTLVVTTDVFCDGPGCNLWVHGVTQKDHQNGNEARKVAAISGWKKIDHKDYCPTCKTKVIKRIHG